MSLIAFFWMILTGQLSQNGAGRLIRFVKVIGCLLLGILKLNFDGSFQHCIRRGGMGGVIGDSSSCVVKRFLGLLKLWMQTKLKCLLYWWAVGNYSNWVLFWLLLMEILSLLSSGDHGRFHILGD